MKTTKKPKVESLPKIHRRLFKIWSEKVRERANHKCEYCGKEKGEGHNKVDAHHLQTRKIKNNPLKWDIMNGICLCPLHHKFSCEESFHKAPVVTINWLMKNIPERFNYVIKHYNENIDLLNRKVIEEIENTLKQGKNLDFENLKLIEQQNPRQCKKTIEKSIFEQQSNQVNIC